VSHGVGIADLFGAAGQVLHSDVTVTASDVDHAARTALSYADRGFSAFKIKVGRDIASDVERIAAVHARVPRARLFLDGNGGYDGDGALALLAELARRAITVELFEQPVPRDDRDGLARIGREGGVMVCADESVRDAREVFELAAERSVGAINLKIMKAGVVETVAMWQVARAAGLSCMIGGMVESELAMSFSAELASALGSMAFVDLDTPLFLAASPFSRLMRYAGDRVELGAG
jgi:L-alanine-DL-glutamate epimerase-like enolase superfamily enzyme